MFRTNALTAAALLALATLAPTTAEAAGETCRGVPATHVGTPDAGLVGTEGPDVVVSNGAEPVRTLGGDDLVCVTGDVNGRVDTGEGNDVVDRSQDRGKFTTTVLGTGSDQFVGSTASDVVWAGTRPRRDLVDRDRDVIDGGPAGRRYGDYVISGEPGQPNPDEVRLAGGTPGDGGSAGTVELHGAPTSQTVLDGTRGSELTLETTDADRVSIDTAAGTFTRDGATGALAGFSDFLLTNRGETRHIDFRGSDADETLLMDTTRNSAYDVRMGGGDDVIALQTDRIHRRVNVFDGGGGRDQLGIAMVRKEVRLDLGRGRLLAGKQRNAVPADATRFEDAEVVAGLIELTGTTGDNDLRAYSCRTRVRALGGDDRVSPVTTLNYLGYFSCKAPRTHFEGGGGDDLLVGDGGADVLLGGPGRDRANGGSGRDVCSAERTTRCEVRR
jgi:hypothetical protein